MNVTQMMISAFDRIENIVEQELRKAAHIRPKGLVSEMCVNYTHHFLSLELFHSEKGVYELFEIEFRKELLHIRKKGPKRK